MEALVDQDARRGVPQVMEAEPPQIRGKCFANRGLEVTLVVVPVSERRGVRAGEDQVIAALS
jgi:hypothetical protein